MAVSATHNGWRWNDARTRLDFYYRGTRLGSINATTFLLISGAVIDFGAGNFTLTHSTGVLTLNDRLVVSADDVRISAGNLRLGAVSAFGTTEPTEAVVMKSGTAPAGAITTSGGIFSTDTVVQKIIAAGTVSNVET